MEERNLTYFVADVHLGSNPATAAEKESRFVRFLRSIPPQRTQALYLLGDIWDFWYEYRDVVPKGYARVFAALMDLVDAGVKVRFIRGNHDIWTYGYLQSLGIEVLATATAWAQECASITQCARCFTTAWRSAFSAPCIPGSHTA